MAIEIKQQIDELMQSAARSTALTADALKQFTDLQESAVKLTAYNTLLLQSTKELSTQVSQAESRARNAEARVKELETNAEDARLATIKAERADFENQFNVKRGNELRGILSDIFRNVEVNRTINGQMVLPPPNINQHGGYGPSAMVQDTQTKETVQAK